MARILIVSTIDDVFGGSERLWIETARVLLGARHDVAVCLPFYKTFPELGQLEVLGASVYYCAPPPRRVWTRCLERLARRRYDFAACTRDFRPDVTLVSM